MKGDEPGAVTSVGGVIEVDDHSVAVRRALASGGEPVTELLDDEDVEGDPLLPEERLLMRVDEAITRAPRDFVPREFADAPARVLQDGSWRLFEEFGEARIEAVRDAALRAHMTTALRTCGAVMEATLTLFDSAEARDRGEPDDDTRPPLSDDLEYFEKLERARSGMSPERDACQEFLVIVEGAHDFVRDHVDMSCGEPMSYALRSALSGRAEAVFPRSSPRGSSGIDFHEHEVVPLTAAHVAMLRFRSTRPQYGVKLDISDFERAATLIALRGRQKWDGLRKILQKAGISVGTPASLEAELSKGRRRHAVQWRPWPERPESEK